ETWDGLMESIKLRVFWDYDFNLDDVFLDLPPNSSNVGLRQMQIEPGYFMDIPEDPNEKQLISTRQTLARLLDLPIPDDDGFYPTLCDLFHDLYVGPVLSKQSAPWSNHAWIEDISKSEPGWDCDFETWESMFSHHIPDTPFQLEPTATSLDYELPSG